MKEEHDECTLDGKIIATSVIGTNEDETGFERVNRKAINSRFKTKKKGVDQSKCSRTMLVGH